MSSELVAALVGAGVGGILAILGGIAQVFIQDWIKERGKTTCDVVAWSFVFRTRFSRRSDSFDMGPEDMHWKLAREQAIGPFPEDSFHTVELVDAHCSFTANFFNTKGTNVALLEYSVQFLKGNQKVLTKMPFAQIPGIGELSPSQAVALPAETATGISMAVQLEKQEAEKVLSEADRAEFTGRLSTRQVIRVELEHVAQGSAEAQEGAAS